MSDFKVVNVPGMLAVKVSVQHPDGTTSPDPNWHREALESQFTYAEFLMRHHLLRPETQISRNDDLVVMWSQLNEMGQTFTREHMSKWETSVDRTGLSEQIKRDRLEKRWTKFVAAQIKN